MTSNTREQIVHTGLPVTCKVTDHAQSGDRPNILLITMDQLRADFLGVMDIPFAKLRTSMTSPILAPTFVVR